MPETFTEAFEGVRDKLESKLDTEYGLLDELEARQVITVPHRTAVEVTWLAVCNGLCRLCIV